MNIVLAAALVLGGVVVGGVFGFLAGMHSATHARAIAILDAQREFRTVAGWVHSSQRAPVNVIRATQDCAEALRVASAELSAQVVAS